MYIRVDTGDTKEIKKLAKQLALRDFREYINSIPKSEEIKPYKHGYSIKYWLEFEIKQKDKINESSRKSTRNS